MQTNPLWNLLTKIFSFLAIILLLLGTGLLLAAYFGSTNNKLAGVLTFLFAVVLAVSSLITVNFSNFKLRSELEEAADAANQLAQGKLFEEEAENRSELLTALKEISDYRLEKSVIANQIAGGDLSVNIPLRSDSDIIGVSFRNMIDKLRSLVQTQDERENLQKSILKLLEEVSEVAAGDLTVQAEVSPEITGAIAEAFNSMTKELRSLIKQVKDVTFQISTSANAINDTTEQLARGSEAQTSQISRTTASISNMAMQIRKYLMTPRSRRKWQATCLTMRVTAQKLCRINSEF